MQFIPSSIEAMRAEPPRKTMTRRVQKEWERLVYAHQDHPRDSVYRNKPMELYSVPTILDKHGRIKWQVGRRYSTQPGRGKFSIGSFLCVSLKGERLQDISEEDATAEGVEPIWNATDVPYSTGFVYLWDSLHKVGEWWADNPEVWAIGMAEYQWEEEK